MRPPYFIETLSRNGEVLQRQPVAALPIHLGRGYDNDFILDDAHTAASHALIEAHDDKHLMLRDLGSQNGTIHDGRRCQNVILSGDTVVRLGQTNLRVRGADHPVAPELTDTSIYGWEGANPGLLGLALIAVVAVLSTWLGDTQSFQPISYLLVIASALAGGLLWGGVWALANRLFGGSARFGRHLFILGCGLVAMEAWKLLSSLAAYAWSLEPLTRFGNHALLAIACGMVAFHLNTIKPQHPRRATTSGLLLMVLGSALFLMSNLQSTGRLGDEPYMSLLLPPAVRVSADHTPGEFFLGAAKLKTRVDAERNAAPKDGGSDDDDDSDDGSGTDD